LKKCKVCAEGYILNHETRDCEEGSECQFPMEKALVDGDYQCFAVADDRLKVQILQEAKAKKEGKEKKEKKKMTNPLIRRKK